MVVGGQLILLRPRKVSSAHNPLTGSNTMAQTANQEVNYDLQVFADRIEFCWIHLRGIGALENSLWAYDARGMRIWLNALAIEKHSSQDANELNVKESVNIPLDFYPLCMSSFTCDAISLTVFRKLCSWTRASSLVLNTKSRRG